MTVRRIRLVFWGLTFLQWFPIGFMVPILVLTMDERGIDLGRIGLVFATYGITTVILELPTGSLADAIGRKPVMILSSALHTLMAGLWLFADSFPLFLLGALGGGIGRALSTGPLEAWYVDTLKEQHPDAPLRVGLAGAGVADGVAIALSSLSVAGLSYIPGLPGDGPILSVLRLPALLAGAFYIVHGIAVSLLIHEDRAHLTTFSGVTTAIPETVGRVLRAAVKPGPVRLIFLTMVFLGISFASVEMLYQPLFTDMLDSTTSATRLFGYLGFGLAIASAAGAGIATAVPERQGISPALIASIASLVAAVAVAGFAMSTRLGLSVFLFLAVYLLGGLAGPFIDHLLHDESDSRERSTMVSAMSLSTQGGVLVTGTLVAQVAALVSISAALGVAAAAMAVCALLLLRIFRRHKAVLAPSG